MFACWTWAGCAAPSERVDDSPEDLEDETDTPEPPATSRPKPDAAPMADMPGPQPPPDRGATPDAAVPPDAAPATDAKTAVDADAVPTPSAPGALEIEGWAKGTTGGAGGREILVEDARGLRDALLATGKRIIKFRKGGIYEFRGAGFSHEVEMGGVHNDVTVDGSTAPTPVTLKYLSLRLNSKNVILRHLRFRTSTRGQHDVLRFNGSAENVVIDHCSFTWDGDDTMDGSKSAGAKNITIQWSLIADPWACDDTGGKACGQRLMRLSAVAGRFSFHHNLFMHAPRGQLPNKPQVEFVNNMFMKFNYGASALTDMDFIGNEFDDSPPFTGGFYAKGNKNLGDKGAQRNTPNPFTVSPVEGLRAELAKGVGATLPCRDGIDQEIVDRMVKGQPGNPPAQIPPVEQWKTACAGP